MNISPKELTLYSYSPDKIKYYTKLPNKYNNAFKKTQFNTRSEHDYREKIMSWLFSNNKTIEDRMVICCVENRRITETVRTLFQNQTTNTTTKLKLQENNNDEPMLCKTSEASNYLSSHIQSFTQDVQHESFIQEIVFYQCEPGSSADNYSRYFTLSEKVWSDQSLFNNYFEGLTNGKYCWSTITTSTAHENWTKSSFLQWPKWIKGPNFYFSLSQYFVALFEQAIAVRYIINEEKDSWSEINASCYLREVLDQKNVWVKFLQQNNISNYYTAFYISSIVRELYNNTKISKYVHDNTINDWAGWFTNPWLYNRNNIINEIELHVERFCYGFKSENHREKSFVTAVMFIHMREWVTYDDFLFRAVYEKIKEMYEKQMAMDLWLDNSEGDDQVEPVKGTKKKKKKKKKKSKNNPKQADYDNINIVINTIIECVWTEIKNIEMRKLSNRIENNDAWDKEAKNAGEGGEGGGGGGSNKTGKAGKKAKEKVKKFYLFNTIKQPKKKENWDENKNQFGKKVQNNGTQTSSSETSHNSPTNTEKEQHHSFTWITSTTNSITLPSVSNNNFIIEQSQTVSSQQTNQQSLPTENNSKSNSSSKSSNHNASLIATSAPHLNQTQETQNQNQNTNPIFLLQHNPILSFFDELNTDILSYTSEQELFLTYLHQIKLLIKQYISCITSTIFPNSSLEIYGSCWYNLDIESSDLDLCIISQDSSVSLSALSSHLISRFSKTFDQITPLLSTSIPVIKWIINPLKLCNEKINKWYTSMHLLQYYKTYIFSKDELDYIHIDISWNSININQISFVNNCLNLHPEMKSVIKVLKRILQWKQMNITYKGGMSSYCLLLWVYSYTKWKYSWKMNNCHNSGVLFIDIWLHYGSIIDFNNTIINCSWQNAFVICYNIETVPTIFDPITMNNVGKKIFKIKEVVKLFNTVYQDITAVNREIMSRSNNQMTSFSGHTRPKKENIIVKWFEKYFNEKA